MTADDFYRAIGLDPKRMAGMYPVLEEILNAPDSDESE